MTSMSSHISKSDAQLLADLTFDIMCNCRANEMKVSKKFNLSQIEFRCIRVIGMEKTINNKRISERLCLSPSRATRIIDDMISRGYLLRSINSQDRRNMEIVLSTKGKSVLNRLNHVYQQINEEILSEVDESLHPLLISGMRKWLLALENWLCKA